MLSNMQSSSTLVLHNDHPFDQSMKLPDESKTSQRTKTGLESKSDEIQSRNNNTTLPDQHFNGKAESKFFLNKILCENDVGEERFVKDDVISDDGIVIDDDSDNLSDVESPLFDYSHAHCEDSFRQNDGIEINQICLESPFPSQSDKLFSKTCDSSEEFDSKNLKFSPEKKLRKKILQPLCGRGQANFIGHNFLAKAKFNDERLLNFLSSSGYISNEISKCTGCDQPILDQFILKVGEKPWHDECLKCDICGVQLTGSCFERKNLVYCKEDYLQYMTSRCTACEQIIPATHSVRRVNNHVYHLDCFQCSVCKSKLKTGDKFYFLDDYKLICLKDHDNAKLTENSLENSCKRPRTTINNQQLEMLKTAYEQSSKPTRHMREQLSNDTGLDIRVVQVWFQNRRAKEKRLQKDVLKTRKEEHGGSHQAITHPNIAENQTFVHRSANFLGKKHFMSSTSLPLTSSFTESSKPMTKPLSTHNTLTQDTELLNVNENLTSFGFVPCENGVVTSNNLNQQQIIQVNNFSLMPQQATASTSAEFNSEKHSFDFHVPQQYVIFEESVLSRRLGKGSTEGTPSKTGSDCSKIAASLGRQSAEIAARPINRDLPVPDFNSAQDSGSINASCPPAMSNPGLINGDDSINSLSIEGSNSLAASSVWYGGKEIFHQF